MAEWEITAEAFDRFLFWIGPNREEGGRTYELCRRRLISYFEHCGCPVAEELTDETINRVIRRLPEIIETYQGEPVKYFYGIAHNVLREHRQRQKRVEPLPDVIPDVAKKPDEDDEEERSLACLDRCLGGLEKQEQELVIRYYQQEKRAKIDHRRELAEHLGIAVNALRIRMHRLRGRLQDCINNCLHRQSVSETN
jgi:RNA polymerase sigma factor (sigma-70 family)